MYGGEYGYNALRIASKIAGTTDSVLTFLYVTGVEHEDYSGLKDSVFKKVDKSLGEMDMRAKKKFVARKNIAGAILEEINEKYDLVILGSAKFRGAKRMLFGSVSYQVAEYADVPVLVVKRKTDRLKKILVCTDGSKTALAACTMGVFLGRALGARVTMLAVAPEFYDEKLSGENGSEFVEVIKKRVSKDIKMVLKEGKSVPIYAARPLEKSINVEILARAGKGVKSVREEILKEAPRHDLVILGSRGLSRMQRVRMGHVSLSVKENADSNVLIVREPKR
jgi:nucleotide-binding universal stress UspA family protein